MKEQDITDELISREETSGYSFEEENSREEDVKILEEMIENANIENMDMNDCFGGEHIEAIEHILSDYKRVLEINEVLLKENEELKEYIAIAPNLDEMTATKYRNIRQDAYIQGRAEEQQKAEQIIYENYIPVQKVKDKISERQFELQQEYKDFEDDAILIVLQKLLEGRKQNV